MTTEPPIAVVRLDDEQGRNLLAEPVRTALVAALESAGAERGVHALVLCGRDDVFCAGAPARRMLAGPRERGDEMWELVRAVLDCPVPVVAAAQGHALGGGLLLALYADITVFSERSRYSAAFTRFGCTPTLGASYLLPAKLGQALGTEMLYTGRAYAGRELAARGAGTRVTSHDRVEDAARRAARLLAGAPRQTVELLKARLAEPVRLAAREAFAQELPGHELTIGTPEVRARIRAFAATDPGSPP
ncbi:enoyl-CoA hydratase-related protein [Amycolatopsis magusensis]|uniref:enoyl-CoA hydratase-related protein n=1 Tax=Amycolatopsis magusensis TaxID=882444 RepID=UPI003C30CA9E